ncbi:MAG: sigma-70 family RNA polymerase sigma factor [Phycisphaerales bacterium]|nr:sigma-70 family RNA polymerase sigma factor [Phycisphaerales bacterium]
MGEVTRLLERAHEGDDEARAALYDAVYANLHGMAVAIFRGQRADHTLQPTAVIHEACLRMLGSSSSLQDRAHFFAVAARAMRQVLLNHARDGARQKRSPAGVRVTLAHLAEAPTPSAPDMLALDEAMRALEHLHERQARIAELRYFGGLSVEEVAGILDLSPRTVKADWQMARAFLRRHLDGEVA